MAWISVYTHINGRDIITHTLTKINCVAKVKIWAYPNGPSAGLAAGLGSEFVLLKKNVTLEVLSCCTKFQEPHVVLEYAHF